MHPICAIFKKEFSLLAKGSAEMMMPLLFSVIVVSLFPLGVGPGPDTLQLIGPGVIWVAALLSALLGLEHLFRDDFQDGTLEQYLLSPASLTMMLMTRLFCHWLFVIVPLILISPLLALFLNLTLNMYWALLSTLLVGTPLLSLVGAIAVALTLSINKGGVLLAVLLLPVFIPLLIFATAAINNAALQLTWYGQLGIIGAMLIFALALCPYAISYAIKVSHH